jgi:hypothetical protein
LGRFISQDPIGFGAGDANLYRYVGNSPLMYVDPLGLAESVAYSKLVRVGAAIGNEIAGGVIGYICGYVEAKYRGSANPHQEALDGMLLGIALGAALKATPLTFQIFGAIAGLTLAATTADSVGTLLIRTACLYADLKTGKYFSKFGQPKGLDNVILGVHGADVPVPGKIPGLGDAAEAAADAAAAAAKAADAAAAVGKNAVDAPRTGAKRGPKTDPNTPHNAKIRSEADKLRAEGNEILSGGGGKERLIPTPGGKKSGRRPDIEYRTPIGEIKGRNVGKTKADGTPVPRELDALDDLNGPGGLPTDYVPYDR